MYLKVFVYFTLLCVSIEVSSKKTDIPPYIKPCARQSPDFEKCLVQHGNDAIPHLVKGDKKLGIPVMNPLKLDQIDASPGPNLKIIISDATIWGFEDLRITTMKVDFEAKTIHLAGALPHIQINGEYDINGKIMVLPIQGNGPCNITGIKPTFDYHLKYRLKNVNGQEYLELTPGDEITFAVENAFFQFENLFNGDQVLGNQVNTFLNENALDVVKEVGRSISSVIKTVAKGTANAVFKKVPYSDLFLD